jgi:hypothetical protein
VRPPFKSFLAAINVEYGGEILSAEPVEEPSI